MPCERCGKPIIFGWNPDTKNKIPLNPKPDPAGNTACYQDGHGTLRARRPTAENRIDPFERLYMPHQATCTGRTPAERAEAHADAAARLDNVVPMHRRA